MRQIVDLTVFRAPKSKILRGLVTLQEVVVIIVVGAIGGLIGGIIVDLTGAVRPGRRRGWRRW